MAKFNNYVCVRGFATARLSYATGEIVELETTDEMVKKGFFVPVDSDGNAKKAAQRDIEARKHELAAASQARQRKERAAEAKRAAKRRNA